MANEDTLRQVNDAQGNWSTVQTGQDTVATAGTAVALNGGTSIPVPDGSPLRVKANPGIGGEIYVGDSNVSASNGFVLGGGSEVELNVTDVSNVWIDSDTNGLEASWVVVTE